MKRFLGFLLAALIAAPAAADPWSAGDAEEYGEALYDQEFTYTFSGTGYSPQPNQDVTACQQDTTVTLTGAGTAATVYDCYNADSTRPSGQCTDILTITEQTNNPIALNFVRGYALIRVSAADAGGALSIQCRGIQNQTFNGSAWVATYPEAGGGEADAVVSATGPDIRVSSICLSGFYYDLDSSDTQDAGEPCADSSGIFYATNYATGSSTGGIQEAIDACGLQGSPSTTGQCVVQAPCDAVDTDQIFIGYGSGPNKPAIGLTLRGCGAGLAGGNDENNAHGTTLMYVGADTSEGVLNIKGCQECTIEDIAIRQDKGNDNDGKAKWGIYAASDVTLSPSGRSVRTHINRVSLYPTTSGSDTDSAGFTLKGVGTTGDDQADGWSLSGLYIAGGFIGIQIDDLNTQGLTCDNCYLSDQKLVAVDVIDGYLRLTNSVIDTVGAANAGCAINLRNDADTIYIDNTFFEAQPVTASQYVYICTEHNDSSVIQASPISTGAATRDSKTIIQNSHFYCWPDEAGKFCNFIDYRHAGVLEFTGNTFSNGTTQLATGVVILDNEAPGTLYVNRASNVDYAVDTEIVDTATTDIFDKNHTHALTAVTGVGTLTDGALCSAPTSSSIACTTNTLQGLNDAIGATLVDGSHFTPSAGVATNHGPQAVGDTDIADGAVDGGAGGEIADGTIVGADLATDAINALALFGNFCTANQVIKRKTGDPGDYWECKDIVPTTAGAIDDGDFLIGDATAGDYRDFTITGDVSITKGGVSAVNNTKCTGTDSYLDGDGNCDTISTAGFLTSVGDTDIADGAVDGGTGGEIADGSITGADLSSSIDLITTGKISGKVDLIVTTDGTETATMLGQMYIADHDMSTSDTVYTLPDDPTGLSGCFYDNGDGSGRIHLTPGSGDHIQLDGTDAAADELIYSSAGGDNGDFLCLLGVSTSEWVSLGRSGIWVEATPP